MTMPRINTLPSLCIKPVDGGCYSRINTLPLTPDFTHKHSTLPELSTHKHSTLQGSKQGSTRDSSAFLYVGFRNLYERFSYMKVGKSVGKKKGKNQC